MVELGERAPSFELPAVVGGDIDSRSLGELLGEDVIVLMFYPADFNPACDGQSSDVGELDVFTMQKDVTVLAVSPDSVYSHRAFAERYDLKVPLLSDTRRAVAGRYGVVDDREEGRLVQRAVFVIDLNGRIQYRWATSDPYERPEVEPIRVTIEAIGGDSTALSRYRVGHARYIEGRRAFTSAMNAFGDHEWMLARSDFERARKEFEEAAEEFDTAYRFSETGVLDEPFDRARSKSNALWQAADWLATAADEFSSGNGQEGEAYREDAQAPLETARDLDEPIDPDDITDDGEIVLEPDEETSIMDEIREGDDESAGGIDLLEEVEIDDGDEAVETRGLETDAQRRAREYGGKGVEMGEADGAAADQIAEAVGDVGPVEERADPDAGQSDDVDDSDDDGSNVADSSDVTDEEVAEIAAELEDDE
ncbi:redoxin domain-containing protein [Halapricum desulfuricans]|uniref:Peroxiredoxin n=1 Tax=Halapricum desulfuricans TaxID=2841257 RepID=A0A897N372_9EURY|nr:redoxin domain-containing protein [Halapricum desulfuricans]QSG07442.1 Peroxiredoxin [Halapricum desulfuricans]